MLLGLFCKFICHPHSLTLLLVGIGIGESGRLTSRASEEPVQIGSSLVGFASLNDMALGALLHEDLLSLGGVSHLEV